jgi:hypothetical protein
MRWLFLLGTLVLTGCATITQGTTDTLVIETKPTNAIARLSNERVCVTPCSIELPKNKALTIRFEKEGFESTQATVTPSMSGGGGAGMAGNVIFGGIIGAGVDATSGALKKLKPNPIKVNLVKEDNDV